MSAFNVLSAVVSCPSCGRESQMEIQFKFGNTWQKRYTLGDRLEWGGNAIGVPGLRRVVVEGVGGACPACGTDGFDCDVIIERDVILAARTLASEREKPVPQGYVVEEE